MHLFQLRLPAFFLFLFLIQYSCKAQNVLVQNERFGTGTFFIGIPNPLSIVVEGYSCQSLVFKKKKGSIEKASDCHLNYWGTKSGLDTIDVFAKKNNRLNKIGTTTISVNEMPLPTATVGGYKNGDSVSLDAFKVQLGVGIKNYPGICSHNFPYSVIHFRLFVIKGQTILNVDVNGNTFRSEELKNIFTQLEAGDKILICDIIAKGDKEINLLPLQYILN